MNFDFSEDEKLVQEQTRRLLTDHCTPQVVRTVLEGEASYAEDLWRRLAEMGLMGTAVPAQFGGVEAGYLTLCLVAQELGAHVAPVPFSSSVYLVAEALARHGSRTQQEALLPKLADGSCIGALALTEHNGETVPRQPQCQVANGRLSGTKLIVADGGIADVALVLAAEGGNRGLYLAELSDSSVSRRPIETVDPTRNSATVTFENTPVEPLGGVGLADEQLRTTMDAAAVLFAFEQIGGAQAALDMAVAYAQERYAFGRPIGSFQALKHMMADMYVALKLAESNCYYAAWALSTNDSELPLAAATARVSATQAFQLCSRDNIQVHGGMGFTWEFDCHLYYRRSNYLALQLGGMSSWEDKLVNALPDVA